MPFTNPTIFKLPNLLDVRRAAKGSIMYFDDPKGDATTTAELFAAGKSISSGLTWLNQGSATWKGGWGFKKDTWLKKEFFSKCF